MTKKEHQAALAARRFKATHKGVPVWDCDHCGQAAVIYVSGRGHICMNCGEEK